MENLVNILQLENSFKGKKVFLTGHTGFKGAWLLKTLSMFGAVIKGYSLEPKTSNDIYNLINGENLCESIISDIRNKDQLISELKSFQPDYVFHLAAQPLVRLSYEIPVETFEVNVIGTANLLEGIRQLNKQCSVVLITTDKVYQNKEWIYPYRETDRLGGYDPYSASKACAEILIDSYRNSFFNITKIKDHRKGIAVARAGNVIGGGDWSSDRLIPDIVRGLIAKKSIIIRNPDSIRPWQHVMEPIVCYLLLAANLSNYPESFSQSYNFGPYISDSLKVEEMLNHAITYWGFGDYSIQKSDSNLHEAELLKLDISKAINELKWQPKMNAKQAVKMTIDWYSEFNKNKNNMNQFTENQISTILNG